MLNPFRCFNSSPEVIRLTVLLCVRPGGVTRTGGLKTPVSGLSETGSYEARSTRLAPCESWPTLL